MSTEHTGHVGTPDHEDSAPVNIVPTPPQGRDSKKPAGDTDVKARAQETAGQVKTAAQDGFATAKAKAAEVGGQAKQAVQDPENAGKVKGGGAAAAGTAAVAVVVWAVRRRRNRPRTRWEKTTDATRQAWERAAAYGDAALASDQVNHAVATGRRAAKKAAKQAAKQSRQVAAAAPDATPRRVGGAGLLLAPAIAVAAYLAGRRSAASGS
ncbi:hypothetical protein [Actinocorallia longicatena]|uniref:DUF3618 domain-containing protein n=1 Tax=Actinocorallia longicatena TaxID=111803 RepID=A0ABP6Q5J6_9ACTN